MKCSVVNAAMVLKKQQRKAAGQRTAKLPNKSRTRTKSDSEPVGRRLKPAVAAAAPSQSRPGSSGRSGTRASGSSGSKTWHKVRTELAAKKEELNELAKTIENTEHQLELERAAKEKHTLQNQIANEKLARLSDDNAKVVKEKVNEVLDGIEQDVCPNCKRYFRFNRAI